MKKSLLCTSCTIALGVASLNSQAALVNGSTLLIGASSNFEMEVQPGVFLPTTITGVDGIKLGAAQPPGVFPIPHVIDVWGPPGDEGHDYTTSPTNVLSSGGASAEVDFSGWTVGFSGLSYISMGTGAWGGNPESIAQITCAVDCNNGDGYSLYYTAIVPVGDPSGFGGIPYRLNLVGTVSAAVPVPAAAWLFGSGLLGLAGVARRKKA